MTDNLNHIQPDNDSNYPNEAIVDNSIETTETTVYFRELENHLITHIQEAGAVFGCVAWLTSIPILDALAEKETSIIVQKEDFLRPDLKTGNRGWKEILRNKYNGISNCFTRYEIHNLLTWCSVCCDPSIDGVRCVGNHNKDKNPAFPRMHNKFLVFCRYETKLDKIMRELRYDEADEISDVIETCLSEDKQWDKIITPYAVWTGSFNFTFNATQSLENALFITNPEVVNAYYKEYGQIAALSEPLDWESDWVAPEWRIGT